MNEQMGFWEKIRKIEKKDIKDFSLLSILISKTGLDNNDVLFVFMERALTYFVSKSESFRTHFNGKINETTDYNKLIELIKKYQAYTPEEKILKYEILNLLFKIPSMDCLQKYQIGMFNMLEGIPYDKNSYREKFPKYKESARTLKNIGDKYEEMRKLYESDNQQDKEFANKANLLSACVKYRPWPKSGAKENYFTEVFCFMFNISKEFKNGVRGILNNFTDSVLENEAVAISQDPQSDHKKGIRWDIEIKANKKSIVIENKIGAGIGYKEIIEYPKCYINCGHDVYILLTGNSEEAIKDLEIGIKHISWFFGNYSISNILAECKTSDEIEDIYIKYFKELVDTEATNHKGLMLFSAVEKELTRLDLLDKFNLFLDGWVDAQLPGKKRSRLPGKDGCVFYIITDRDQWLCPFKISKKGVFNIQWLGGPIQKNTEFKNDFIKKINDSSETPNKSIITKKQSFNIKDLSKTEIQNIIKTFAWLTGRVNEMA